MTKFKVGDKVEDSWRPEWGVGVIENIRHDTVYPILALFDDKGGGDSRVHTTYTKEGHYWSGPGGHERVLLKVEVIDPSDYEAKFEQEWKMKKGEAK